MAEDDPDARTATAADDAGGEGPPASVDGGDRTPSERRKRTVELAGAIIIGIAAVLTAFATYQGSQFDGDVTQDNTEALKATLSANDRYNDATAQQAVERDWFFAFITEAENQTPAADFLLEAMPDEVFALADEWQSREDGILDPFSPEGSAAYESYAGLPSVGLILEGNDLNAAAQCQAFEGGAASRQGDGYGLSTIYLAIALVVGGIAALLHRRAAQVIALTVSVLSLVIGAGVLLSAGDEDAARTGAAVEFFLDASGNPQSDQAALVAADAQCR